MLGPPKLRLLGQPVTVSLEKLVPADPFYRHLDTTFDLSVGCAGPCLCGYCADAGW